MPRTFTQDELQALARLYEARNGLFGDENTPVSLRLLATFMGKTNEEEADRIMQQLENDKLVRRIEHQHRIFFFMTDQGAAEFEYANA